MNKKMVEIKVIDGGFNPHIDLIEVDNIRKKLEVKLIKKKQETQLM